MGVATVPAAGGGYDQTKLVLQQTITSSGAVTIPAGVTWVWAVVVGGGGAGRAS